MTFCSVEFLPLSLFNARDSFQIFVPFFFYFSKCFETRSLSLVNLKEVLCSLSKVCFNIHRMNPLLEWYIIDIFTTSKSTAFPTSTVDDRLKDTQGDLVGVCIPYTMDTKYYTAKVDFWLDEIDSETEKETIKAYCEKESEVSKVIDAFVYIFDKAKPMTFDTLKNWVPFLEQAEPNIKLCIGTSAKEPLTMEKDAEINDWCLANGFDYVDMDETTDTPMDRVGMDLALEILQTNFWDGMVKKNGGVAEEEDLMRELQELKLQQNRDVLDDDIGRLERSVILYGYTNLYEQKMKCLHLMKSMLCEINYFKV